MITYFIKTEKGHYGPIEISVIKKLSLKRNEMLWNNNLDQWITAENLPDLKESFHNTPPLLSHELNPPIKENELKRKIFQILAIRFLSKSFLFSLIILVVTFMGSYLLFQPNKFGENEINEINKYYDSQRRIYEQEQAKENAGIRAEKEEYDRLSETDKKAKETSSREFWELFLKTNGLDPFENAGIVPSGPAAVLPNNYVDGFWDYYSGSDGQVFLNLTNIPASFESRRIFLIEKATAISVSSFFLSFVIVTGFLFLIYNKKIKSIE